MSKKIKIKSAPGSQQGWNDGTNNLVGCWFEETSTPGQYTLYGPLKKGLQSNTPFSFDYNNLSWSITNFAISEATGNASGSWTASDDTLPETVPSKSGGDPESGSFQANDNVEVDGESSVSASA